MIKATKLLVLITTIAILFYALVSKGFLPNIETTIKDALIISIFIICSISTILYMHFVETKLLKETISKQHFQMETIINSAPFAMFLKDLNGNILMANEYYIELAKNNGYSVLDSNINILYENPEASLREDCDVIKNKKYILIERQIDAVDAPLGWYRIIKSPVFDKNNNVINIVVIAINIDDERKAREQQSTFIATLTHDFKTPTIAQMKALDLLLKNSFGELTQSQAEIVSQVKDSCEYMYNLIFTILDTYLYEKGQIKLEYSKFNWNKLVDSTIKEISSLASEKKQRIIISSKINSKEISADKSQIKRVITNLLSNAITHGMPGSDIEIYCKERNSKILFEIRNKSQYIAKKRLESIFEKFQSDGERGFGKIRTGLGLYLVKQIISSHGGLVHATSDKSGACVFGFEIPKEKMKINFENETDKKTKTATRKQIV